MMLLLIGLSFQLLFFFLAAREAVRKTDPGALVWTFLLALPTVFSISYILGH
jgi:hypothetical protein